MFYHTVTYIPCCTTAAAVLVEQAAKPQKGDKKDIKHVNNVREESA